MTTDHYDIKTNIKIGQQILENIPNDIRPGWAGLILSRFDNYIENKPTSITQLYPIIDNKERWKEAHEQFNKIRRFLLDNKNYQPEAYLLLAELIAKITYNASEQPAPFDNDSGHFIASLAIQATEYFDDNRLEEEVKSAILLFSRNKNFKDNLTAAKDFLLYKKIDDILWFDWDPIGVNDIAPRDEYQSYVPEIFGLVKAKTDRQEIANRLHKFETENMGMSGTIENCLTIADKILKAQ
ncbi:hypothetical protein [Niabella drilacis]|uniref:Uncharacterized protein n=1 Tax=Niabella drilacis (strain DSM 25811 / CCM 8410 / CCUG 62505 / LMG 26954 / E90) TaxID=1285928 RepID=A0A1G6J3J4_NIADE|nr:hypothetical protein [Niabella drilacis]SDC13163.1 hypothetical protein SAMN04487894_101406 [Niabella drilacis]